MISARSWKQQGKFWADYTRSSNRSETLRSDIQVKLVSKGCVSIQILGATASMAGQLFAIVQTQTEADFASNETYALCANRRQFLLTT